MKPSILLVGNFLSAQGGNRTMAEEFAHQLDCAGYSLVTTSTLRPRLLRLLDMLLTTFMRRTEYRVAYVEVYSGIAFLWAELVCHLLKILQKSFILTLHGGQLPAFAVRWPGRVKRLLKSAAIITAPSRYLQETMRPYREDIRLLPNPVDLSMYPFHARVHPRPVLIWLRAFHNIYNPALAPRMISILVPEISDISLTMVGPDKGDGSLQTAQKVASELGVQTHISFPGGVSKAMVPEWLDQGDIFINTANIDNTPVSILEAMACGLCIVSTNVGGLSYLLEDGQDALLVPPDDADAMACAVRRILTNPELAGRLSINAHKKAEQFDWSVILPKWEKLMGEVAHE